MRDRLFLYLFIIALAFILFLAGGISTYFQHFPYDWIDNAIAAKTALTEQSKILNAQKREANFIKNSRYEIRTNKNQNDKSHILLSGFVLHGAILIDTSGKRIHQWQSTSDTGTYWRNIHAYPNGDILVVTENSSKSPYGQKLLMLDKDSNVKWQYDAHVHHQSHITPDGNIIVLAHSYSKNPGNVPSVQKGRKYLEDFLVTLDSNGKELQKISITKAMIKSPYKRWLHEAAKGKNWDVMHTNSAVMLNKEQAKAFPMFKQGDILLSMRAISALAILDQNTKKITWAKKHKWKGQHDAEFLNDGRIMLFDNWGKRKNASRIVAYSPKENTATELYSGTKKNRFSSETLGSQQLLKNGNLLITESLSKRVFEVNPKTEEIIWDLKGNDSTRIIFDAHKYAPNFFTFLPKAETQKAP